jgi:hypothetical protein
LSKSVEGQLKEDVLCFAIRQLAHFALRAFPPTRLSELMSLEESLEGRGNVPWHVPVDLFDESIPTIYRQAIGNVARCEGQPTESELDLGTHCIDQLSSLCELQGCNAGDRICEIADLATQCFRSQAETDSSHAILLQMRHCVDDLTEMESHFIDASERAHFSARVVLPSKAILWLAQRCQSSELSKYFRDESLVGSHLREICLLDTERLLNDLERLCRTTGHSR